MLVVCYLILNDSAAFLCSAPSSEWYGAFLEPAQVSREGSDSTSDSTSGFAVFIERWGRFLLFLQCIQISISSFTLVLSTYLLFFGLQFVPIFRSVMASLARIPEFRLFLILLSDLVEFCGLCLYLEQSSFGSLTILMVF
jgi:hypothetical protein